MGTSRSLPPSSGGAWSGLKRKVTARLRGSQRVDASSIVGDTVRASGGIGVGGRGGGGAGAGGAGSGAGVGGIVGRLGGFGAAVREGGLSGALKALRLSELEGRSAVEVAARISEHLAEAIEGVDGDLAKNALRETLLEAAALGDADGFDDLERGLEAFLQREGPAGLMEIFLSKFVLDAVWANIESYVVTKADDQNAMDALMRAVEGVCDAEVRGALDEARRKGEWEGLDWFGEDGLRMGRDIFTMIDSRVRAMGGA